MNYDVDTQRIKLIRGLEIKRVNDVLKWSISKKQKADGTRKKKQDDVLSTDAAGTTQAE